MTTQLFTTPSIADASALADAALSSIAAGDIGACAHGIFREGASWIGRSVGIAGEHLTGSDIGRGAH